MPDPRAVFEHPEQHWDFLTALNDTEFEGQFFDRKEAGRVGENGLVGSKKLDSVLEQITGCISAFANTNKSGSLLVVGISAQGEVKGVSHLSDTQRSRLTGFNDFLSDQAAQAKFFDCTNETGQQDFICLIYVPYTSRRICQTLGNYPRVWTRQGSQNICLNQSQLEQLRRDKGVVDYEQANCGVYDVRDLDLQVLQEFRKVFLQDSGYEYSDEDLLYQVGAINRNNDGYNFTNAGMLFFAANPQRVLSASFIRLLRFETDVENIERGLPTFDRKFTGSITKQVRDIRAFFRDSGFFKLYQTRNSDGGFLEVPEYPLIAVDEAIVNAVAHREYAIGLPIECESYRNAFVVRNSGRLQQRDQDVPAEFSLETMRLNSVPRNPKLIEWLKMMRDERGAEFVRALSEGTRRMRDEMKRSGLTAPIYKMSESQTTVILFNNAQASEFGSRISQFANVTSSSELKVTNIKKSLSNPLLSAIIGVIVGGGLVVSGLILGKNFTESPLDKVASNSKSNDDLVANKKRLAPDKFIRNHYKLLQDKQLDKSWEDLSASFKTSELVKGFEEYKKWWNSVDSIEIISIQIIEESSDRAVVEAGLIYSMRDGKKIPRDRNKYFYLVYRNDVWLINEKSETYTLVSH